MFSGRFKIFPENRVRPGFCIHIIRIVISGGKCLGEKIHRDSGIGKDIRFGIGTAPDTLSGCEKLHQRKHQNRKDSHGNEELQQSQKIALSLEAEEEQHALEEGKAAQETQAQEQERAEDEPTDEPAVEAADEPTEEDAGQEEESSEQA